MEFSVANRNQWLGVDGAPVTYHATASYNNDELNSQFGLRIVSDKIGYSNITDVSLAYSYVIKNYYSRIVFGLAGSYSKYGFDPDKIVVFDPSDPYSQYAYESKSNFNADFGMEYIRNNLRGGFSINKMFDLFLAKNNQQWNGNYNYFYLLYRQHREDILNFGYGLSLLNSGRTTLAEVNFNTYFRYDQFSKNVLQLGLTYRTFSQISINTGIYLTENFKLLYTFEKNFNILGAYSDGSHEIVLKYRINRPKQWGFLHYWENQTFSY